MRPKEESTRADSAESDVAKKMVKYITYEETTPDSHQDSEIASFYEGRSVFITGASGFIGKCLLEKLLRSCPKIECIYILMRPKRGLEVGERVEALVRSALFDRLKSLPNGQSQLEKIRAVKGDITKERFGLSDEDVETLSSKVTIVIHSAATVKFVEPLKTAIENNVISVDNLVNLASSLRNLEAMVHVSTAYSNCDRKEVDEVFYEPPFEADKLIELSRWLDPEMLEEITPKLLGKRPNTYTLTKAVAESLLRKRTLKSMPHIPIAMIRPSIVGGIWKQPIPGWVDNFNGPTGVILALMTGGIRAMHAYPNFCADIVPVDVVANLIICAARETHKRKIDEAALKASSQSPKINRIEGEHQGNIEVYNCSSGTLNPVIWNDISRIIIKIGLEFPCNTLLREPGTRLVSSYLLYSIYDFLMHASTAHIADFMLRLFGQKPRLVNTYNRLVKMVQTLKPFTTNQWLFDCSNVTSLYQRMNPIDREIFNFDIRQIEWEDYIKRYYIGSKVYALKDDPKDIMKAKQKLTMVRGGSRAVQLMFLAIFYYVLVSGTSLEQSTLDFLYQAVWGLQKLGQTAWSSYHETITET